MRNEKKSTLGTLGLRIKQIRKSKGLTQLSLAKEIGKDHTSINKLEKGRINPSYIFLLEIANGLNVEVESFFENNGNKKSQHEILKTLS